MQVFLRCEARLPALKALELFQWLLDIRGQEQFCLLANAVVAASIAAV